MPNDTLNGIPRVDPRGSSARWKRVVASIAATKRGTAIHRAIAARLDAPIMRATRGHLNSAFGGLPIVVLISTGARSGQPRETPLTYFTDGDDVILVASNYGGARHPAWYHNLMAHPECELRIGKRGGRFVAREASGADRDRLYALAIELYPGYANYAAQTDGVRTIRVLRLTPAG
ncbi:nitroreductase family deazaflavin-dependent oxidoreductase [Mycobacterium shimoidei]|jgi:deazaflavin-dependent oxidoreductase (nitroreductase family)|uniref:Nitroreductase family deazaflavin-dependent oxidoreductase n=1 Tax=Mycobacterium shimoidei TaxID=29313 RepID=A0A1E3TII4_MYCSH|nr:nitroreductase family deazaflavin-dependent oxidoreductase [Mycobacterium shimoidei]MCV7257801.1 nitroreductase family deazaflavin-dependent oxidoreductase [Mycobacterium shimoidei]ODR14236.1 nitroreductase [Mycobacterium shimoidei]ORW83867.1 nitroreductase [Mycobacterium shimoidei]SRX91942.1 hypothetical protein [Streptomyces bingchenggensis BCW-1] [Mycobacterium shimoidei]